jgi:hypothetical protein
VRELDQATVLQDYAKKVLPEIAAHNARPDPPGVVTATLMVSFSTREPHHRVEAETLKIMREMASEVKRKAEALKRSRDNT